MINGIAGKPGGGKSYEAVKNHVIPALKNGRMVVTNLPLQIEHFVAVLGEQVRELIVLVEYNFHDYGSAKPFSKVEDWLKHQGWKNDNGQGVLFVVDEAHLSLPNGKGSADFTKVLEFLSMHRHYGFDVLLITQNFKKVHRDIRDMVQLVYRCIKKSMFGQDDAYIIKVHEGCTTQVVNTDERVYESYVFKFYKSHTKSETQIVEATTVDVVPWWKHRTMKISAVLLIIAFLMAINLIRKISKDDVVVDVDVELSELADEPLPRSLPPVAIQSNNKLPVNQKELPVSEPVEIVKSPRVVEYERMVSRSKTFHPFYKVELSVAGFSEDIDYKIIYFSAQQNGQHVFSISSKDLLLAGYDVRVLGDCSVKITYFDYEDFLTCNRNGVRVAGTQEIASTTQ